METKKISKWDAAPKSIRMMLSTINGLCDGLTGEGFSCEEAGELEHLLVSGLEDVLDDYNKLEAKHQLDCGLISDYAEENARLKQKNENASNNIRDLRRVLEENDIATYLNPVTVSWGVANVALQKKTEHFNTQLDNLREKLREAEKSKEKWIARYHDMSDICSRDEDDSEMLQAILRKDGYTIEYEGDIDDETVRCQDSFNLCKETTQDEVLYQYGRWTLIRPLNFSEAKANADAAILRNQCSRHIDLLDKLRWALEDKGIYCEWNEAALKWNLRNTANICESWSCKHHFDEELRIRCKEIDDKNKLIDELKEKIETLEKENKSLRRTVKILDGEGYF
jgi:flagellar motility protein MotE (MotC chaperone)